MSAIALSLVFSLTAPFMAPVIPLGNTFANVGFGEVSPADADSAESGGQAGPGTGSQGGGQTESSGPSGQSGGFSAGSIANSAAANTTVNAAAHAAGLSKTAPTSNAAVGINAAGNAISLGLTLASVPTPVTIVVGIVIALVATIIGALTEPTPPAPPAEENPDDISAVPGTAGPSDGCFKAETLVAVAVNTDGTFAHRRIAEFKSGDPVLGAVFDSRGMPMLLGSEIKKLLRHEARPYPFAALVTEGGAAVDATTNHVFVTKADNSGLRLEKLRSGDRVVVASPASKWDTVSAVKPRPTENVPVFNVETGTENYFVSQDGIHWVLVHNGGGK